MSIGKNINLGSGEEDRIIRKTTKSRGVTRITRTTRKTRNSIKPASLTVKNSPADKGVKTKMTFYIRGPLLKKLYNFAYWDRYSLTDAFNVVVSDGLKGKNTKEKDK